MPQSRERLGFNIKKRVNFAKKESLLLNPQVLEQINHNSHCLVATPEEIIFPIKTEAAHIAKLRFENQTTRNAFYSIVQPQCQYIKVKAETNGTIMADESVEVHVWYKPPASGMTVERDRIIIQCNIGNLEVPIIISPLFVSHMTPQMTVRKLGLVKRSKKNEVMKVLESELIIDTSSFVRETKEEEFLARFKSTQEQAKIKSLTNQRLVGSDEIDESTVQAIIDARKMAATNRVIEEQSRIRNRFSVQFSGEAPIVDRKQNKIVRWNEALNDITKVRINGIRKLLQCVTRFVISHRIEKAKKAWMKYVMMDASQIQILQRVRQDVQLHQKQMRKLQVECPISFPCKGLTPKHLAIELPTIQWQTQRTETEFLFDINPRVGFDDWVPMEEISQNYQQCMDYKSLCMPCVMYHSPNLEACARSGAVEEYAFVHSQQQDLIVDTVDDVELQQHQEVQNFEKYQQLAEDEDTLSIGELPDPQNMHCLSGVNFEQQHYTSYQQEHHYDYGFTMDIMEHLPDVIGQIALDDQINLTSKEPTELTKRMLGKCLREVPLLDQKQHNIAYQMSSERQVEMLTENGLRQWKSELLSTYNSRISTHNKFIKKREHKILF